MKKKHLRAQIAALTEERDNYRSELDGAINELVEVRKIAGDRDAISGFGTVAFLRNWKEAALAKAKQRRVRLATILDEGFGPREAMGVDELLCELETEIYNQRQNEHEQTVAMESMDAKFSALNDELLASKNEIDELNLKCFDLITKREEAFAEKAAANVRCDQLERERDFRSQCFDAVEKERDVALAKCKELRKQLKCREKLWKLCRKYIDDLKITGSDCAGQSDSVCETAPGFAGDVGEIVGFYEHDD